MTASQAVGELLVRPFQPADRQAVRDICAATCWMGRPCPEAIPDEWTWAEIWTQYFTDIEPQLCYVVQAADGRVVGYMTGAMDQRRVDKHLLRQLPGIAWHVIRRRLMRQPTARKACVSLLHCLVAGELDCPRELLRRYPAALHSNLLPEARGGGLAREMMQRLLADLRSAGAPGVHARCMSINVPAGKLLARMGFELAHSKVTRAFWHITRRRIEIQTWARPLA